MKSQGRSAWNLSEKTQGKCFTDELKLEQAVFGQSNEVKFQCKTWCGQQSLKLVLSGYGMCLKIWVTMSGKEKTNNKRQPRNKKD